MKFMKLGSKPDTFQNDGNKIRYVETELASDIIINVGDVKFYLHKFPLLSKSALLQKMVSNSIEENNNELQISDIPGGSAAFESCAKFCYGMTVTLNAYSVVSTRCAAEYLGMHETIEKGNLIFKIDVFINSSIFRSWKDSIILLQSTTALLLMAEDLKVVSHCIDSISSKASINISKVDWSFTYTRKKLLEDNINGPRRVPRDWWVDDVCELEIELFKRVIMSIKSKGIVSNETIGDALKAYALKHLPDFGKFSNARNRTVLNTLVWLLPSEKNSVSCSFLLKLLKATNMVDSGERTKRELVRRIGSQLDEASVSDLLIKAPEGERTICDIEVVKNIVKEFIMQDNQNDEIEVIDRQEELEEEVVIRRPGILSDASKLMVAKVIDGYLAEIAKDMNLPLLKFVELAEMVSGFPRSSHDALYRAIDTYLKDHPGITKRERKRICKLMDCKKLSAEACMHAVQNERLPLRVVVQVLFFEQIRASSSSGTTTPDLPKCIRRLNSGSNGSSRSATTANTEEDWDATATAGELKALKAEIASLRMSINGVDKNKMKGVLMSKHIFTKTWWNKGRQGKNCGADDASDSLSSVNQDEVKSSKASFNRRFSVS